MCGWAEGQDQIAATPQERQHPFRSYPLRNSCEVIFFLPSGCRVTISIAPDPQEMTSFDFSPAVIVPGTWCKVSSVIRLSYNFNRIVLVSETHDVTAPG